MLRGNKVYIVSLLVLAVGFLLFVIASHNNYMDLLDVNDGLVEQIDKNRKTHEEIVQQWQGSYLSLQSKYGKLIVEHEELKQSVDSVGLPVYLYTKAEVELLAVCVQCEAGKKNEQAQKHITKVILNRVKSSKFADTIEEVIYEKVKGVPQFSVAYNGIMDECTLSPKVLANVYSVIMFGDEMPDYVMYFYSTKLKEDNWVKTLNVYDTIEGTVFAYE